MPDICKCSGIGCPKDKREKCYRFTSQATPGRQSYFKDPPIEPNGDCVYMLRLVRVDSTSDV